MPEHIKTDRVKNKYCNLYQDSYIFYVISESIITMAQEQQQPQEVPENQNESQQQLTSEQLLPSNNYVRLGDRNYMFNPHQFNCDHLIIVEILKNHPIFPALNNTAIEIPQIYIKQFWNTIHVVEN